MNQSRLLHLKSKSENAFHCLWPMLPYQCVSIINELDNFPMKSLKPLLHNAAAAAASVNRQPFLHCSISTASRTYRYRSGLFVLCLLIICICIRHSTLNVHFIVIVSTEGMRGDSTCDVGANFHKSASCGLRYLWLCISS